MPESRRARLPLTAAPASPVPRGASFRGLVLLRGPARIDGQVDGRVVAWDTLWVGREARVRGPVEAGSVVVEGAIEGDVRASGRIALEATGRVRGELTAGSLVLAEGSFLEGSCQAGGVSP
jgi:cytoskeletal protein CcmA (bactofilin family)